MNNITTNPFISIVIPLYNKEKFIARTLESVLAQTFKNFEVLIVNDGSTDSSVEVAKKYIDDRFRIINQKNSGVSAARNKGIKLARAKYIAFLDADDTWEPNFLSEIQRLIKKYPQAGLYGTGYRKINELNKIEKIVRLSKKFTSNTSAPLSEGVGINTGERNSVKSRFCNAFLKFCNISACTLKINCFLILRILNGL